jgi:hypothetical protein
MPLNNNKVYSIFNKESVFKKENANNENVFKNKSKSYVVFGSGSFAQIYYGTANASATATASASADASASATSTVSQEDADRVALEIARKNAYDAALKKLHC